MATSQARVAAVRRAVAIWWAQPYSRATTETALGRYAPTGVDALLPRVNTELQKLPGFIRGLSVRDWQGITASSLIKDVYYLSAKCF